MKKSSFILYPTKKIIKQEISQIIEKSAIHRPSFHQQFMQLLKHIGWRQFLPNRQEALYTMLTTLIIFSVLIYITQQATTFQSTTYHLVLLMFSPFIFATLSLFSFYDKQQHAMFELEMTTKYTAIQFISQRMFLYSVITMLVNSIFASLLAEVWQTSFFKLFLVSSSGLFLFASGFLLIVNSNHMLYKLISYILAWFVVHSLFIAFPNRYITSFFAQLPVVVLGCFTIVFFIGCYFASKRLYITTTKEVSL